MNHIDHPDRIPPLTGAHNFRDVGGYPTISGKAVATGKVYRSGTLAELTDEDHTVLKQLGLRAIHDLRTAREQRNRPSRLPDNHDLDVWSHDKPTSAGDLIRSMSQPDMTPEKSRQLLIDFYQNIHYEHAEAYRALFIRIAEGETPLVFHCSAGKDRTGAAAALMLDVLGVPRETIIADYVFTDRYFDRLQQILAADPDSHFAHLEQRIWEPLLRAEPAYIETMFSAVQSRHGSAEGYFREALELDAASIEALRAQMLL